MSLKHALLGFLNYGPMTGYELKKFFDTSVSHFWSAELSQIYPSLKQMEAEGLIEMQVEVQEDRPNRKVCSITDDGRRELLEWMARPTEAEQVREPILVKVFFGASLPKQELLQVLRERKEAVRGYADYLGKCQALVETFARSIGLERDAVFWGLTPSLGLKQCQAALEWVDEAIDTIERIDESGFDHSHPHAGACPDPEHEINVRAAVEILDRVKGVISGGAPWNK
jgi:DNA-binding PadR family transcriptional regulator